MSYKGKSELGLFEGREIRKAFQDGEWWFVITDIVAALTDAADPSDYWKKMRKRDPDLGKALQGGGKLTPPCLGVRNGRRASETPVLEYRGHLTPDPVHPQPQGRTVQALAGPGGQGAD